MQKNLQQDKGEIEIAKNTRIVTVKQDVGDDFEAKGYRLCVVNGVGVYKNPQAKDGGSFSYRKFLLITPKYHELYESRWLFDRVSNW